MNAFFFHVVFLSFYKIWMKFDDISTGMAAEGSNYVLGTMTTILRQLPNDHEVHALRLYSTTLLMVVVMASNDSKKGLDSFHTKIINQMVVVPVLQG